MEGDYQISLSGSLPGYELFNIFINYLKIMRKNEVTNIPYETQLFLTVKNCRMIS